jgi:alpha-beta hydrolase superfamily lysophospholipase
MQRKEYTWTAADQLPLFVREWLPDETPRGVVLLVHGLGEHTGRYDHVAAALAAHGLVVVGPDLRGHGKTAGKRGHTSYDAVCSDLAGLRDDLSHRYPGLPLIQYGHSMGAAITLYDLVTHRPGIDGAIVTSPGLVPAVDPGSKLALAKVMRNIWKSLTMANGLDHNSLSHDPAVIKAYQNDPLVTNQISVLLGLDLIEKGTWLSQHAADLPPIPVLLMVGSSDHIVNPKAVADFAAQAGPQVTYREWPGMLHELHNEPIQNEVLGVITGWLEERLAVSHPQSA